MLAGLCTGIGGLISVVPRRTSGPFLSVALGFSAGVMLYVSFLEIMPKALATATVDRLLHHAVVVQIEGASYRLRGRGIDSLPSIRTTTDQTES